MRSYWPNVAEVNDTKCDTFPKQGTWYKGPDQLIYGPRLTQSTMLQIWRQMINLDRRLFPPSKISYTTWPKASDIKGFSKWNPVSLKKTKCWSGSWIQKNLFEVILISEFTDSDIRITSTFRYFCQANRLIDFLSKNL